MQEISDNMQSIQQQIAAVGTEHGRDTSHVKIVAVTKKQPIAKIKAALDYGITDIGENHVQEALAKIRRLHLYQNVNWHFHGTLQSNKVNAVAEHFSWVHSLDRAKIAQQLNEKRPNHLEPLNVLIQVNVDDDSAKNGVAPQELNELVQTVSELPRLKLRGLMTMPTLRQDSTEQRQPFVLLKQHFDELQQQCLALDTLSMGMSNDFEAAVAEGATMLRLGSALFGTRTI